MTKHQERKASVKARLRAEAERERTAKREAEQAPMRAWAKVQHGRLGLAAGLPELLATAAKVKGTRPGLTRTKLRKAARALRGQE